MQQLDSKIAAYTTGIFLRYFRAGRLANSQAPSIAYERDIQFLRANWAICVKTRTFLEYLWQHTHELVAMLSFEKQSNDAIARGRIDARASLLARRLSGLRSTLVYDSPTRSLDSGPNLVVAWVMHSVHKYAGWLSALQTPLIADPGLAQSVLEKVAALRRIDALRGVAALVRSARPPGELALRDAERSRRLLYRNAAAAYRVLAEVEAGSESAIASVLKDTMLAPIENWRRFELAVALGIGDALSMELGLPLQIAPVGERTTGPIIRCGNFEVLWQTKSHLYSNPRLEPSELRVESLLKAYGLSSGASRPDILVVDIAAQEVITIIEVKYVSGHSPHIAFQQAVRQVVWYGRGYSDDVNLSDLLERSMIALSHEVPIVKDESVSAPMAIDFSMIESGRLRHWVRKWINHGNRCEGKEQISDERGHLPFDVRFGRKPGPLTSQE